MAVVNTTARSNSRKIGFIWLIYPITEGSEGRSSGRSQNRGNAPSGLLSLISHTIQDHLPGVHYLQCSGPFHTSH